MTLSPFFYQLVERCSLLSGEGGFFSVTVREASRPISQWGETSCWEGGREGTLRLRFGPASPPMWCEHILKWLVSTTFGRHVREKSGKKFRVISEKSRNYQGKFLEIKIKKSKFHSLGFPGDFIPFFLPARQQMFSLLCGVPREVVFFCRDWRKGFTSHFTVGVDKLLRRRCIGVGLLSG